MAPGHFSSREPSDPADAAHNPMSRNKVAKRRERRSAEAESADLARRAGLTRGPRRPGWPGTLVLGLLSTCLGVVLVAQFVRMGRAGFLGGVLQLDYARLTAGSPSNPNAGWGRVAGLRQRASTSEAAQRHLNLIVMLTRFIDASAEQADSENALREARIVLQADEANLAARLLVAFLTDAVQRSGAPGPSDPRRRFDQIAEIVAGESPPTRVRLYQPEYFHAWQAVLRRHVGRDDVCVSIAAALPPPEYHRVCEGLTLLCTILRGLAEELAGVGASEQARTCEGWITALTSGLLEHEGDPAIQLLCARQLLEQARSTDAAAEPLARLIADFHGRFASAPLDLTDNLSAAFGRAATCPVEYNRAFGSLVAVAVLAFLGGGCVLLLAGVSLIAAIARAGGAQSASDQAASQWYVDSALLLLAAAAMSSLMVTVRQHFLFSEWWSLLLSLLTLFLGPLLIITLSSLQTRRVGAASLVRGAVPTVLLLIVMTCILLPPRLGVQMVRAIGPAAWLLGLLAGLLLFVALALVVARSPLRLLARRCGLAACLFTSSALAILPIHRALDRRFQTAAADGRTDEFTARLGADWREKYLAPVQTALGLEAP